MTQQLQLDVATATSMLSGIAIDVTTAVLAKYGIVVQQPVAEAPAKRAPKVTMVTVWTEVRAADLQVGYEFSLKADGSHSRIVDEKLLRSNGTILFAVTSGDDCTGLVLNGDRSVFVKEVVEANTAEAAKAAVAQPKAKKERKGRYSTKAEKVTLKVCCNKASIEYGKVVEDVVVHLGGDLRVPMTLIKRLTPMDEALNDLRTFNEASDAEGGPVFGFNIVGTNGNKVQAKSLLAARRASRS